MGTSTDRPVKLVYITGTGRSGTTLLGRLLGEAEGFVHVGEAMGYFFDASRHDRPISCACGRGARECAFWSSIPAIENPDAVALGTGFQRVVAMPRLLAPYRSAGLEADVATYRRALVELLEQIRDATGCDTVVDTSKWPANPLLLEGAPEVEVYVIHLVRDGRGFIQSRSARKGYMARMHPLRAALVWVSTNLASRSLRGRVGRYCLLRYEEMVEAPRAVLEQVVEQVSGTRPSLDFLDGSVVEVGPQHIVGANPDKFESGEIEIRSPRPVKLEGLARLAGLLTLPLNARFRGDGCDLAGEKVAGELHETANNLSGRRATVALRKDDGG